MKGWKSRQRPEPPAATKGRMPLVAFFRREARFTITWSPRARRPARSIEQEHIMKIHTALIAACLVGVAVPAAAADDRKAYHAAGCQWTSGNHVGFHTID